MEHNKGEKDICGPHNKIGDVRAGGLAFEFGSNFSVNYAIYFFLFDGVYHDHQCQVFFDEFQDFYRLYSQKEKIEHLRLSYTDLSFFSYLWSLLLGGCYLATVRFASCLCVSLNFI
jgi:hypothetical protein